MTFLYVPNVFIVCPLFLKKYLFGFLNKKISSMEMDSAVF